MSEPKAPKIYAPGMCKTKDVNWFCVSIGIPVDDFCAFLQQHRNEKGWVNLELTERRTPNENGTHNLTLDTWKPKQRMDIDTAKRGLQQVRQAVNEPQQELPPQDDQVPF